MSSATSPFDSLWPLPRRLPIVTDPLAPLFSEIFDLKVADKPSHKQNSTPSDNKSRLKLSAREPIESDVTGRMVYMNIMSFLGRGILSSLLCTLNPENL